MNKTHYHNGKMYTLVASTRDFRDKEPKSIIETMQPIVADMDRTYFKLQAIINQDKR